MKYKGYEGHVAFDPEARIFHGEVINIRDVVTFQGRSVEELEAAFRDSVDDYIEFCAERGEDPDKPFKGEFIVRADPDLHKRITIAAKRENKRVNAWVVEALDAATKAAAPSAGRRNRRGREMAQVAPRP